VIGSLYWFLSGMLEAGIKQNEQLENALTDLDD
jgi:hypothetical protein